MSRNPQKPLIGQPKPVHPYAWLWEPLEQDPTFVLRAMFGAKAVYLHGLMTLCFSAGDEPWRGLLICTEHRHHSSLIRDFPALHPHPILPKWLYLPESADVFESCAAQLVRLARQGDPRIGVVPKPRKQNHKPPPEAKPTSRTQKPHTGRKHRHPFST